MQSTACQRSYSDACQHTMHLYTLDYIQLQMALRNLLYLSNWIFIWTKLHFKGNQILEEKSPLRQDVTQNVRFMQYVCTISAHLPALCIKQKQVQLSDCGPVCSIINADIFFLFFINICLLCLCKTITFKSNITIDISLKSSKNTASVLAREQISMKYL